MPPSVAPTSRSIHAGLAPPIRFHRERLSCCRFRGRMKRGISMTIVDLLLHQRSKRRVPLLEAACARDQWSPPEVRRAMAARHEDRQSRYPRTGQDKIHPSGLTSKRPPPRKDGLDALVGWAISRRTRPFPGPAPRLRSQAGPEAVARLLPDLQTSPSKAQSARREIPRRHDVYAARFC
jgi:hypothetical protein